MKSYGVYLHKAIESILLDASDAFPLDRREFDRDLSRLSSSLETRGMSVYTIDLPALGKHLDKCLSSATYVHSGLPLSRSISNASPIPKLFRSLMLRVFELDGMLKSEPCIQSIAFLRQLYAFAKKVKIDCNKEKVYDSIQEFYMVDQGLPKPSLNWEEPLVDHAESSQYTMSDYSPLRMPIARRGTGQGKVRTVPPVHSPRDGRRRPTPSSSRSGGRGSFASSADLLSITQLVADILSATLGHFDPESYRPKHGPGAVSDLQARSYKYRFETWSDKLEAVFPQSTFAYANFDCWLAEGGLPSSPKVSKLISVPKTQKGPRLIASEPVAHQWCQQVIRDFLEDRVERSWIRSFIHFRDQRYNQRAALDASCLKTSSWTVDLSAASDRVTTRFVERLFRNNTSLLGALIACRTSLIKQDIDRKSPRLYSLIKFSTMGSACTFPIESLCFLTLAISAILYVRNKRPTLANIRSLSGEILVFGDDIIVPSDAGECLESLLAHFDFKVNDAKTHRNGRFRESCGVEAYDGYDVTPSYVLQIPVARKPESIISSVECSNNFYRRGWLHTAEYLRRTIPMGGIPFVSYDSGAFGYICRTQVPLPPKRRWNKDLHIYEYKVTKIRSRSPKIRQEGCSVLLQFFTEDPPQDSSWESGVAQRSRIKLIPGWEREDRLVVSNR